MEGDFSIMNFPEFIFSCYAVTEYRWNDFLHFIVLETQTKAENIKKTLKQTDLFRNCVPMNVYHFKGERGII